MYNSNDTNGTVLGATTAGAGAVAILPNTSGNLLATIFSIIVIVASAIVLTSFIATRVVTRVTK